MSNLFLEKSIGASPLAQSQVSATYTHI